MCSSSFNITIAIDYSCHRLLSRQALAKSDNRLIVQPELPAKTNVTMPRCLCRDAIMVSGLNIKYASCELSVEHGPRHTAPVCMEAL